MKFNQKEHFKVLSNAPLTFFLQESAWILPNLPMKILARMDSQILVETVP